MDRHDQPGGYYEIDFPGRLRLTHYPSGFTCLRHDWMTGRDAARWVDKLRECSDAHPEARYVYDGRGELVGDLRDMPAFGGGFAVGDLVLTRSRGDRGGGLTAREVVAVRGDGDAAHHDADDAATSYVLEDGSPLYFSGHEGGWMTHALDGRAFERAFRPHPSQDPGEMRETDAAFVARVLGKLWAGLDRNERFHSYAAGTAAEEGREEGFRARYAALRDGISRIRGDLAAAGPEGEGTQAAGLAEPLLDAFEALVGDVQDIRRRLSPSSGHDDARIGEQLPLLEALRLGMRRRGLLPESPGHDDDTGPPSP